ncbi:MAG: aminopeptidase [Bryobacterales bacterium]|nr:aminopeptidase [Bryobacterales bacterium]
MTSWFCAAILSLALQDIIGAWKQYQRALGLPETGNFRKRAESRQAFYRCYYTGKLELPDSYDRLRLVEGTASGCAVNQEEYDVFFYPIEAVADGAAPVTGSLEAAAPERQAVVVAHEDFHEMLHRLPVHLAEAAATLAGFVVAAQFARDTAGPDSELARALADEAKLFFRKAEIVNRYHARLSEIYARARAGKLSREQALTIKRGLFAALERECLAIAPKPRTFNPCPAALNNAGLAFDYTYTKHYPLLYRSFDALGGALSSFLDKIKSLIGKGGREAELLREFHQRIHGNTGRDRSLSAEKMPAALGRAKVLADARN